jgi:hypothetical protein
MDLLEWLDKLQGIGVAGLALLFLYITNKYHVTQRQENDQRHREEMQAVRTDYNTVLDRKDEVISELTEQLRSAT